MGSIHTLSPTGEENMLGTSVSLGLQPLGSGEKRGCSSRQFWVPSPHLLPWPLAPGALDNESLHEEIQLVLTSGVLAGSGKERVTELLSSSSDASGGRADPSSNNCFSLH